MRAERKPATSGALAGPRNGVRKLPGWVGSLQVLALLALFLVGVRGLGNGFELLGAGVLDAFFEATKNPFVGLLLGILATSIVQSSSVTTSMVVALVAAGENALPIAAAIPMVMGANIGTTVTNTIVALGHVARPPEFRRAIAAGTCDDFFNLLAVCMLLPLELTTGVLERLSEQLVRVLPRVEHAVDNPVGNAIAVVLDPLSDLIRQSTPDETSAGVVLLVVSALCLLGTLAALVKQLRRLAGGRAQAALRRALSKTAMLGIAAGAIVTAILQSSSLTLSVLVPFAATNIVTLEQLFPIVLGANFGTTLTALLAATAVPAQRLESALQIALVHMLFNLVATLVIFPIRRLRRVPLDLARWIADEATSSKMRAATYVIMLFYGAPALGYFAWRSLRLGGLS